MYKYLFILCLPLLGQTNPAIRINSTKVQGGVSGNFLKVNSNGTLGQGSGGGGAGCTTSGSAGQVLSDDGAGGCASNSTAAGFLTFMGTSTSANLATLVSNETGTGVLVFNTSPTFITPILGTPTSGVMTNMTGLALAGTPLTTRGDILFAGAGPVLARLALGAANTVLHGSATDPAYSAIVNADITNATIDLTTKVTGVLPTANIAVALANQTSLRSNAMAAAVGDATIGQVIAHGATALDFASTTTGACATVITATATGAASTDVIIFNANASIKAVTGYAPASTGGFSIAAFPTTNTVSFEACNWTAGTVDPGSITVNWVVIR